MKTISDNFTREQTTLIDDATSYAATRRNKKMDPFLSNFVPLIPCGRPQEIRGARPLGTTFFEYSDKRAQSMKKRERHVTRHGETWL